MAKITLEQANAMIAAGFEKGRELDLQPLTIVVLDDGGHLVSVQRQDRSGIMRFDVAFGKAWGSLGMGRSSRDMEGAVTQRPHFGDALTAVSGGRFVPVAGGVLAFDGDGIVAGAVGISGDNSDNDEICAIAGIEAAGLAPNG
ncbi:MAG: heme-binding protein [Alphaproteobacteria bacterium]|nr:heme-binding protein [Alphaproteobacteria bacterium]MCZ6586700.1 heme-binding protein [Alphaproteobacteria bacterium]MCZ6592566.1 heme-binding protein [Alphaproteobacteria bacterium]